MTAIVRVKRCRDEQPADSLSVLCKRARLDDGNSEDISSVFKYAGTVNAKGDEVATEFVKQAIRKEKLKKEYKCHVIDHDEKRKKERMRMTASGRGQIVAKKRAINFQALQCDTDVQSIQSDTESGKRYLLYDVEKENQIQNSKATTTIQSSNADPSKDEVVCNGVLMTREKVTPESHAAADHPDRFVYDLYYINAADFDYRTLENALAVELFREAYMDEDEVGNEDAVAADEDSENEENNWRNDYPDEDPLYYETIDDEYYYGEDGRALGGDLEDAVERYLKLDSADEEERVEEDFDEVSTAEIEQFKKMSGERWQELNNLFASKLNNS